MKYEEFQKGMKVKTPRGEGTLLDQQQEAGGLFWIQLKTHVVLLPPSECTHIPPSIQFIRGIKE